MPKDIGKVGTESRTFIEPIANRKDGIQAIFLRQKATQSSPLRSFPHKRKRSVPPNETANDVASSVESQTVNAKTEHSGGDITCLDGPSTPTPGKARHWDQWSTEDLN